MPPLFADAGYWIALMHAKDQHHKKALALAKELGPRRILTTQMVLTEALNTVAGYGDNIRKFAVDMVKGLSQNPDVEIFPQTASQFREAVQRYESRRDKKWGLTDCASFLVMEERSLNEALAHDRDFEQAGYKALMRESN